MLLSRKWNLPKSTCPKKSNNNSNNNESNNIIPQRVQLFAKWMLILEPTFQSFVFLFVVVCLREWNANVSGSGRSVERGVGRSQQVFRRFSLLKKIRNETKRFCFSRFETNIAALSVSERYTLEALKGGAAFDSPISTLLLFFLLLLLCLEPKVHCLFFL